MYDLVSVFEGRADGKTRGRVCKRRPSAPGTLVEDCARQRVWGSWRKSSLRRPWRVFLGRAEVRERRWSFPVEACSEPWGPEVNLGRTSQDRVGLED